jgi:HSP20 family protein
MIPIVRFNKPALADDFLRSTFFGDFFDNEPRYSVPAVNIAENEDNFNIEIAAPGLNKDDFKINLDHDVLTISSEKEAQNEKSDFKRREFNYRSFKRSFSLPDIINSENISATYANGILSVQIPKREEAKVKPAREIAIA